MSTINGHLDRADTRAWRDLASYPLDLGASCLPSVTLLRQQAGDLTISDFAELPSITEEQMRGLRDECIKEELWFVLKDAPEAPSCYLARTLIHFPQHMERFWHSVAPDSSVAELRGGLARALIAEALDSGVVKSPLLPHLLAGIGNERILFNLGLLYLRTQGGIGAERIFLDAARPDLAARVDICCHTPTLYIGKQPIDGNYSTYISHAVAALSPLMSKAFAAWCREHRIRPRNKEVLHGMSSLHLATELVARYDYGISVAHSGLSLGWAFNTLGLDVGIVKTRRHERSVSLTESSAICAEKISGKSVIILENDMVWGHTLRALVEKLAPLKPKHIDVAFNTIPTSTSVGGVEGVLARLPREIRYAFGPASLGRSSALTALEVFRAILITE